MKVYLLDVFAKDIKKETISNKELIDTAEEVINGLYDAQLGHNFYKKRIALNNKGVSGTLRMALAALDNIDDTKFNEIYNKIK